MRGMRILESSCSLVWTRRAVVSAGLLLLIWYSVGARQRDGGSDRELILQLLKRVEELEAQVKELKSAQAKPVLPEPVRDSAAREDQGNEPQPTGIQSGPPLLQIRGFADLEYRATTARGERHAFGLGQFDLFITSRISEKLSVLSEVVLEAGADNDLGIDLERLLLQYSARDYLNVGFGRYHTAIGYYNTAFHHGAYFETATGRPFLFAFEDEGGMLPIHNVGLTVNGRIPSGKLRLGYVAEIGNGRKPLVPEYQAVQNVTDDNNGKAVNLGLTVKPDWVPGLQAGISVYRDRLTPEAAPSVKQTIVAAHAVYQTRRFEFLNEALVIQHSRSGRRSSHIPGFYTQISRLWGKARPYFRYQFVNAPEGDPVFSEVGRVNGPSFGLRYDVSEFAAFKAQYDRTARREQSSTNGLTLQMAFTF